MVQIKEKFKYDIIKSRKIIIFWNWTLQPTLNNKYMNVAHTLYL